jgi:hypothetical protein
MKLCLFSERAWFQIPFFNVRRTRNNPADMQAWPKVGEPVSGLKPDNALTAL